jgi:hypothetical protein
MLLCDAAVGFRGLVVSASMESRKAFFMKALGTAGLIVAATTALCTSSAFASGTWAFVQGGPIGLCSPHLLHGGNVLAQACGSQHWYKEHPT